MKDDIQMHMDATTAEMITNLDPTIYRKHIWYNKIGKPMLYIQLKMALYGTLLSDK